jgi:hypothetical protein
MKINFELSRKSIKNAIKVLKQQKDVLTNEALPEYMQRSAEWIRDEANRIVNNFGLGSQVAHNITSSWHIEKLSDTHLILYNMSWKAAYVEFGVGIVGQEYNHPNAKKAGYEYDLDSPYKYSNRGWAFSVSDQTELDLPEDDVIESSFGYNGLTIYTKGSSGAWYLFNALESFKLLEQQRLWEEIKKKYWS